MLTQCRVGSLDFRAAVVPGNIALVKVIRRVDPGDDPDDRLQAPVTFRGAQVGGSVFIDGGFYQARQERPRLSVSLDSARVAGDVVVVEPMVEGQLSFHRADVAGRFDCETRLRPESGLLDMQDAHVGELVDAPGPGFWAPGQYRLRGFTYDAMAFLGNEIELRARSGSGRGWGVGSRLAWLRDSDDFEFRAGSYDQLAAYRRAAHDSDARTVLIEKQRGRSKVERRALWWRVRAGPKWVSHDDGWWMSRLRWLGLRTLLSVQGVWDWFVRSAVGYGYRPFRILGWFVALWVMASSVIYLEADSIEPKVTGGQEQQLFPVWFALDLLLPVANLRQRDAFVVHGLVAVSTTTVFIVAGWVLGLVLVAGLTGLFKRD